jgi:catechol 2,3-dioxygenase-like lactoylglutathione lyase family enzyme
LPVFLQIHGSGPRIRQQKLELPPANVLPESMITGAHALIHSQDAEADRAFFRDVLGFPSVDAGDGWLIFALPPSELGVHPAEGSSKHELALTCDDIEAEIARLAEKGVKCGPISDEGWGLLTMIRLPGGGVLGLYEPHHPSAHGTAG